MTMNRKNLHNGEPLPPHTDLEGQARHVARLRLDLAYEQYLLGDGWDKDSVDDRRLIVEERLRGLADVLGAERVQRIIRAAEGEWADT